MGSAGLHTRTKTRTADAPKGLPQHNGASRAPVDVEVARMNARLPLRLFPFVQGMKPAREAVSCLVHEREGFREPFETHDAQERTEEFRPMREAPGLNPVFDP